MMDDDPWGSTTDPWGTPAIDVIGIRDDAPVKQAETQSPPTHTSSLPVPPAVGNFAEVDPWASPAVSVRTQEKTPSPIPDIHSTLSSGTPQASDSPLPPQWTSQGSLEGDTWRTTEAVPTAPASGLAIQLSPEQIPLPGTDNEESDLEHPAEEKPSGPSGAVWKASDEQDNQLDVPDLPTSSEPPRPLVVEDETFNPFSQSEGPSDPIPGNSTEGFAPSSFDDDAFGGFTAGGFQDRAEFAGIEYGDGSQGWGNPEGSSSIPSADGAWGVESDANNLANEDDDEGGFQSSSATYGSTIKVANVNEEDGFHSIPAKEKEVVPSEKLKHDEWEAARRDIELREARAPAEVVNKLVSQWKDVLEQIFPLSDSTDLGKDVEDGMDLETTIRRDRKMARLMELPDDRSIYFQPVNNTVTWERYQDYVSNLKLDSSASVLAKASAEYSYRINRRKSQEQHDAWQARSRLGEATQIDHIDQKQSTLSPGQEAGRSRWSFWGKKSSTPTVPLTTSGGGMLEIKSSTANTAGNTLYNKPGLPIGNQRIPTPPTGHSTPPLPSNVSTPSLNLPIEIDTSNPDTGSSAVGRFFGKLRRTRPQSPSVDISNKDLELTQDDFSFLAEVPSLAHKADPAFGDLLSLDGSAKSSEQISSLEAMLNSKPMPLPSQLAPPPRPSTSRGAVNHSVNEAVPSPSKPSSLMDLFGDLDLNATASSSKPAPSGNVPSFAYPSTTNPSAGALVQRPIQSPPISLPRHEMPALGNSIAFDMVDADGFGNFAAASHSANGSRPSIAATAAEFDEFGDFEQFDMIPSKTITQALPTKSSSSTWNAQGFEPDRGLYSSKRSIVKSEQPPPTRLDQTSAAQLVSEAARNTSQWPAPPSPNVPALPPPTSSRNGANFPHIGLAPPASASSSRASTPLNFDFLNADPPALPPPRVNSPAKPLGTMNPTRPVSQLSKGQGLTASDLSFFDSL